MKNPVIAAKAEDPASEQQPLRMRQSQRAHLTTTKITIIALSVFEILLLGLQRTVSDLAECVPSILTTYLIAFGKLSCSANVHSDN